MNAYHPDVVIENPEQGGGTLSEEWQVPEALDTANFRADGTGYRWRETSTPNDEYFAENNNTAGYISGDAHFFNDKLNVFGGLRVEHNRFRILGVQACGVGNLPAGG